MQSGATALSLELRGLLRRADGRDLRIGEIIESFPERGHLLMIVLFSFPMSLPISPPFLGGVFGAVLAFLSFYLVLGRKPWVPKTMQARQISFRVLSGIVEKLARLLCYLEHMLRPRLLVLSNNQRIWRMHAIFLLAMSCVLAMPVPMPAPFTNSVAALPIFLASLGMLERDGLFILMGYASTALCAGYYTALLLLGKEALEFVLPFALEMQLP